MMRLDVATLSIHTGKGAAAQSKVEQYFKAGQGAGTLCASWTSEIGGLDRVLVLRAFDDSGTMHAERERMLVSGDIFGASDHLNDVTFDACTPFPYFPPQLSGSFGGVYEFRVYRIKLSRIRRSAFRRLSRHCADPGTASKPPNRRSQNPRRSWIAPSGSPR